MNIKNNLFMAIAVTIALPISLFALEQIDIFVPGNKIETVTIADQGTFADLKQQLQKIIHIPQDQQFIVASLPTGAFNIPSANNEVKTFGYSTLHLLQLARKDQQDFIKMLGGVVSITPTYSLIVDRLQSDLSNPMARQIEQKRAAQMPVYKQMGFASEDAYLRWLYRQ